MPYKMEKESFWVCPSHLTTENNNVVQINENKLAQIWGKNFVHEALKYGRCISKAKTKAFKFVLAPVTNETSFVRTVFINYEVNRTYFMLPFYLLQIYNVLL